MTPPEEGGLGSSTATPPDAGDPDIADGGAAFHYRALERLYAAAPINRLFRSQLAIEGSRCRVLCGQHFEEGETIGRGTGTFMRSHIALSGLSGYAG